jgi:hypothetical protein
MHHDGVWLAFGVVQDIMGAPRHLLRCRVTLQAISNIPFQTTGFRNSHVFDHKSSL